MRLLHASDLHGHAPAYEALFASAARRPDVDAVVLAGDLLPHPHDRERLLEGQIEFVTDTLRPMLGRLHHARPELPVFAVPGNDDFAAAVDVLTSEGPPTGLRWLDGAVHRLGDLSVAGGPWVPVTPFYMKDYDRFDAPGWRPAIEPQAVILTDRGAPRFAELAELEARPTIEAELERLAATTDPERTIYVVHGPPARTRLDVMRGGAHIGSEALRRFVEVHQPPLTLHGHVHESPALTGAVEDRIGRTVCVNAGASLNGLRALEIVLEGPGPARVAPLGAAS